MSAESQLESSEWQTASLGDVQLNLTILKSGQSFRWVQSADNTWLGVVKGRIWHLKQSDGQLVYKSIGVSDDEKSSECSSLSDYFQLDVNLNELYSQWSSVDDNMGEFCGRFPGVRVLRQDPLECLFSFICSANNNIVRISGMIARLCESYGVPIGDSGKFAFPTLEKMAENTVELEANLRRLGFGYRAKYIAQTVKQIEVLGGVKWLENLRKVPYKEAKAALMTLSGVGAKVADCVCLMSLDKPEAVPIDTHVWQITQKYFRCGAKGKKSLTDKLYIELGDFYRDKFGPYAGWAQTVLFMGDLQRSSEVQSCVVEESGVKKKQKVSR